MGRFFIPLLLLAAVPASGAMVNVFQYPGMTPNVGNLQTNISFAGVTPVGTYTASDLMFGNTFFPLGVTEFFGADIFANINVIAAGTYTLQTTSDDGSLLMVDGHLVVNNNLFQGATTRTGSITLTAGTHLLEVQYFQGAGGAVLSVPLPSGITYVDPATETYMNIYSASSVDANFPAVRRGDTLIGTIPTAVLNYGTIYNNIWQPFGLQGNFVAEMKGYFDIPTDASYTFGVTSDDGSWLIIDGSMVVNNGFFQGPTLRSGTVFLTAGKHVFDLQYFQGGGGAALDFTLPAGVTMEPIPEPGTLSMLGLPLIGIAALLIRKRA
jgi:hypothetical protein